MAWVVRYYDRALNHEMLSRECASKEDALEEAWSLAQEDGIEITAVEGPDDHIVSEEEIQQWFDQHAPKIEGPGA